MRKPETGQEPGIAMREIIYRGMLGRSVERVRLADGTSAILKPVQGDSNELYVYENVLPLLPDIYPRLLATWRDPQDGAAVRLLFEDAGELKHGYKFDTALDIIRLMAAWHARPTVAWPPLPASRLKPGYGDMAAQLLEERDVLEREIQRWGIEPDLVAATYRMLEADDPFEDGRLVFSHGDLHAGNYADAAGRLVVLDWEHAHMNLRYWDLFHLIDLTHPLYPRTHAPLWRSALLDAYYSLARGTGEAINRPAFLKDYHRFSTVFSLWMLQLIRNDLSCGIGPWPADRLAIQLEETRRSYVENIHALLDVGT